MYSLLLSLCISLICGQLCFLFNTHSNNFGTYFSLSKHKGMHKVGRREEREGDKDKHEREGGR